jgi:hypothetical protein
MPKGTFIYSEARLAEHIGMPRAELKFQRDNNLREGRDWKNKGGEIALSLRAVVKLCDALRMPKNRLDVTACYLERPGEKKNRSQAPALLLCDRGAAPTPIKMRVRRIFGNPRLMEAQEIGSTRIFQVVVKSNANFLLGMEFKAIPDPANPGFYRVAGQLPRWRGHW